MSLHTFLIEPFGYDFMLRALLSALILGVCGGLLGCLLVLRRLSLMGDALSHSLLPGVALAFLVFGPNPLALFAGALAAGLLTALCSALLSRLTRIKEETAFGALFILFFGAGIAIISLSHTRLNLLHFLFGNILGVGPSELTSSACVGLFTILSLLVFRRPILLETFDPVFFRATGGRDLLVHVGVLALIVLNLVSALQTMGIVLSLGLFLLPAASAYLWCDKLGHMLGLSAGIGVLSAVSGILLSYHAGLPSGSAIVLCLGSVFLASALFSTRYGLLAGLLARRQA